MNEETGGGGRRLEVPQVAPTVPRQLSRVGGRCGPPADSASVPASLGAGSARAWEKESGQRGPGAEGLALGAGGCQLGPGVEVACPADPSSLPPTGGATGSPAPQTA